MPRDFPPLAEPAILLTELPEDSEPTAIFFGGLPQLPPHLEWPRSERGEPLHFVAQLELGRLPRSVDQAGQTFAMPDFPAEGTLFVFMEIISDEMYSEQCVVLFSSNSAENLPERQPPAELSFLVSKCSPEDAGYIEYLYAINPDLVSECGKVLIRRNATSRAFLSHRAENPHLRDIERAERPERELYQRDLAYADQMAALGFNHERPFSPLDDEQIRKLERIPPVMRKWIRREMFSLDWKHVHEWAKRMWIECYNQLVVHLELDMILMDTLSEEEIRNREKEIEKIVPLIDRTQSWPINRRKLVSRFALFMFGEPEIFDVKISAWMEQAVLYRDMEMSEEKKREFIGFVSEIASWEDDETFTDLFHATFRPPRRKIFDHLCKVFYDIATEWHGYDQPRGGIGFSDHDARITQVFGLGYLQKHAAVENEDKVLLLQVSEFGGLDFDQINDGLCQLWITHEALAAGDFSDVFMTMETT